MKLIGKLFSSIGPIAIFIFVMVLLFGVGIGYTIDMGPLGEETQKIKFGDFMDLKDLDKSAEKVSNYMIVMISFSVIAVLAFVPLWIVKGSQLLTLIVSVAVVFASFIIAIMGICVLVETTKTVGDITTRPNDLTLAMWSIFGIILPFGSSLASGAFGFLGFKRG